MTGYIASTSVTVFFIFTSLKFEHLEFWIKKKLVKKLFEIKDCGGQMIS